MLPPVYIDLVNGVKVKVQLHKQLAVGDGQKSVCVCAAHVGAVFQCVVAVFHWPCTSVFECG